MGGLAAMWGVNCRGSGWTWETLKRLRLKVGVRCWTPCFTDVETKAQRGWAAAPAPPLCD